MTADAAKKEIKILSEQLNEHIYHYYVEDAPTITDYEYDMMMRRLKELEAAHPEYVETTKWNECQILFTDDLESDSSKMQKAKKMGVEIKKYA